MTGLATSAAIAPAAMTTDSSTASVPLGTTFWPALPVTWSCSDWTCSGSSTCNGA